MIKTILFVCDNFSPVQRITLFAQYFFDYTVQFFVYVNTISYFDSLSDSYTLLHLICKYKSVINDVIGASLSLCFPFSYTVISVILGSVLCIAYTHES